MGKQQTSNCIVCFMLVACYSLCTYLNKEISTKNYPGVFKLPYICCGYQPRKTGWFGELSPCLFSLLFPPCKGPWCFLHACVTPRQWCDSRSLAGAALLPPEAPTQAGAALGQFPAPETRCEGSEPAEVWQTILTGVLEPTSPACPRTAPPLREWLVLAVSKGCHGELDLAQVSNIGIWYQMNSSIGHFCSIPAPAAVRAHLSAARWVPRVWELCFRLSFAKAEHWIISECKSTSRCPCDHVKPRFSSN